MEARSRAPRRHGALLGRASECAVLDDLVSAVRGGQSQSLVLRGEAGIGKTALLKHLVESASDLTVLRASGVESEMELAYASLHLLYAPHPCADLSHLPEVEVRGLVTADARALLRSSVGFVLDEPVRDRAFERALRLIAVAETRPVDEVQRARAELLHGQIAVAAGPGSDGPSMMLNAARRLEPLDLRLARETYLTAWGAAFMTAGPFGGTDVLLELCRSVRDLPAPPVAPDLLDGVALLILDGGADAVATLRRAAKAVSSLSDQDALQWGRMERLATGEKVRKRTVETRDELTDQERQIALPAEDGLSNAGIGARLFLSPRTVEWHLRMVSA